MTDMTTTQAHNRYALSMPAHNGEAVTQAHTDYCEANGHADLDGAALHCHRCGTGTTTIADTAGPYGRGTYVHACYNPTFCTHAGGIGDGCGGATTFTPDTLTPAPCPECSATALCEHYAPAETWPLESLTHDDRRVQRQNKRN